MANSGSTSALGQAVLTSHFPSSSSQPRMTLFGAKTRALLACLVTKSPARKQVTCIVVDRSRHEGQKKWPFSPYQEQFRQRIKSQTNPADFLCLSGTISPLSHFDRPCITPFNLAFSEGLTSKQSTINCLQQYQKTAYIHRNVCI